MKLKQLDYHRNGVAGMGFHVAIATYEGKEMLLVRFPKEADDAAGGILCAAFDLALLDKREIRHRYNSFRGDFFARKLDPLIAEAPKGGIHAPYNVDTEGRVRGQ